MQFRKISSVLPVSEYLTDTIADALAAGKRVLWLLSGGSAISIAVEVSKLLSSSKLANLTVTLIDERYGEVGHADSNWRQLEDAGFTLPGATLQPVLTGVDQAATAANFAKTLQADIEVADYRIGLLGIGPDGHTSGILPHSPAVTETNIVCSYDSEPYRRVTTTPPFFDKLDEAVVYAVGEAKWQLLDKLETDIPIDELPAQVLKRVPKLIIFNDHKGDDE